MCILALTFRAIHNNFSPFLKGFPFKVSQNVSHTPICIDLKKVQVGNDQEKAQSERNSNIFSMCILFLKT